MTRIFNKKYPRKNITIQFVDDLKDRNGRKIAGNCEFINRNTYLISISAKVPVVGSLEVLCHELSHAAAGYKNNHNKVFKEKYKWLQEAFISSCKRDKKLNYKTGE